MSTEIYMALVKRFGGFEVSCRKLCYVLR